MVRLLLVTASLAVLGLLLAPRQAITYSSGPSAGYTGAPGDATCLSCHGGFPLNSGGGDVAISAPETYMPGEMLTLNVSVSNPSSGGWQGFQLTVRDAGGESVGTLSLVDASRTKFAGSDPAYVTHTLSGSFEDAWDVRWQAPDAAVGPVTIYASGLGGNADATDDGDRVYTTSVVLVPNSTATEDDALAAQFVVDGVQPNPFRDGAALAFDLPVAAEVELRLFDTRGREVWTMTPRTVGSGSRQIPISGRGLRAGTYVYRLTASLPTGRVTRSGRLVRVR